MKKLLFFSFLLFSISIFSEVKAQGSNLEFNRVFLFNNDNGLLTVPNNKIWKINSGGVSYNYSNYEYVKIFINNDAVEIPTGNFPFIIPEGTTISVSVSDNYMFSITEYNIVP